MTLTIRKAERKQAKIKLGIQGPSGSGKTFGALHLAKGLCSKWDKIVVIDTENRSSDLYAHLGEFGVLPMESPYSPEEYIAAIELCELAGFECIIIDSISHEWEGAGGILEIHGKMSGNSFANWAKVTPRHNAFVQKILQSKCHVISTIRTKQHYVLNERDGKFVPERVGMKGITREGMDYEMTVVFDLDVKHMARVSKDRTGIFNKVSPFRITEATGKKISKWCNEGTDPQVIRIQVEQCSSKKELEALFKKYPEYQAILKDDFNKRYFELNKSA